MESISKLTVKNVMWMENTSQLLTAVLTAMRKTMSIKMSWGIIVKNVITPEIGKSMLSITINRQSFL